MEGGGWNSLEVANLLVGALTPILLLIMGIVINRSVRTSERSTALRSEIYKEVGGDINDIFSYLSFVGGWKELTPADVIARKRAVDKAMHTYRPFFSEELFRTYLHFMEESFGTFAGPGQDAKIRSVLATELGDRRLHGRATWDPSWDALFTGEQHKKDQQEAYDRFLRQLARDLRL